MENTNNLVGEWILTDPDSFQICRERKDIEELTGDKTFELYQLQAMPEDKFVTAHDIMSLADIDILSVLDCYGYENLDQVKKEYGNGWEQIVCECAFELRSGNYENVFGKYLSWDECVEFICRMSGYRQGSDGVKTPEARKDILKGLAAEIERYCLIFDYPMLKSWQGEIDYDKDPLEEARRIIYQNLEAGNVDAFLRHLDKSESCMAEKLASSIRKKVKNILDDQERSTDHEI